MDKLRAIKKQSIANLPGFDWVKSGVFPLLISLCLHIGIAGGVSLALYAVYNKSGRINSTGQEPVYITFVQETSDNASLPEKSKPVQHEKPPQPKPVNDHNHAQNIQQKRGKAITKDPHIKLMDKHLNLKNKDAPPPSHITTTAQAPPGSNQRQNMYQGGMGNAEIKYQDQVRAAINANRIYPRQARRLKMEGESIIALEVMRNGHIHSYRFIKSTGHHLLDQAIEEIIQQSNPLPQVPESIKKVPVIIQVPLAFDIHR